MVEAQSNAQFAPQKFKGLINENAKDWIRQFENYCQYKEFNADKKMALFKVLLVDSAAVWYDSLPAANTDTWAHVKTAFETRYDPPDFMKYQHANDLFNKKQGDMSVDDFCAKMQRLANEVGADDLMLHFAVINGLNPEIRNHVTRAQPNTWTDLVQQAKVGKMCIPVAQPLDTTLAVKLEIIQDQLKQLTTEKAKPRGVFPVSSVERSDHRDSGRPGSPKRVRFDPSMDRGMQDYRNSNNNAQGRNWNAGGSPNRGFGRGHGSRGSRGRGSFQRQGSQNYSQPNYPTAGFQPVYDQSNYMMTGQPTYTLPPPSEMGRSAGQTWNERCGKCGRNQHQHPNMCPAVNEFCRGCGRKGHFLRVVVQQQECKQCNSHRDSQRSIIQLAHQVNQLQIPILK